MNELNKFYEEKAKEDETHTFFPVYGTCYSCISWLFYFIYFSLIFPMVFTEFLGIIVSVCLPILLFFIAIHIYIKYTHYKKIIIAYNIYYQRVKVFVVDELNYKRKVLDIPKESAGFGMEEKEYDYQIFTLHIFDNFVKNPEIDIRKMNMEKFAPKYHWSFESIWCESIFRAEDLLKAYIGEKMIINYNFKYISKKNKNIKYFKTANFLSFNFHSRIKCYIISVVLLITILIYVIGFSLLHSIVDKHNNQKKKNYNETNYYENQNQQNEDYTPVSLELLLVLSWIVCVIIIIFLNYIFKYIYKRIDIFKKDNIIFIGITSFFRKNYIKNFIFDYKSFTDFKLTSKDCKNSTLELNLEDEDNKQKIQKICDFTGESKENLDTLIEHINDFY